MTRAEASSTCVRIDPRWRLGSRPGKGPIHSFNSMQRDMFLHIMLVQLPPRSLGDPPTPGGICLASLRLGTLSTFGEASDWSPLSGASSLPMDHSRQE